jgi:hypothetical protein
VRAEQSSKKYWKREKKDKKEIAQKEPTAHRKHGGTPDERYGGRGGGSHPDLIEGNGEEVKYKQRNGKMGKR